MPVRRLSLSRVSPCVFLNPTQQASNPWRTTVMDDGSKSHPFGHALVAGMERYPSKVTRSMSKKRAAKRSKVKPFIKIINYNHLMPTRYTIDLETLKGVISQDTFKEPSQREEAKKTIKKAFEERYQSGKNKWFFTPLRF